MADLSSPTLRRAPPRGDDRLFLTERKLRQGAELMFFAYRYFTEDADKLLTGRDYGRAHHRALHFIGRQPGISVAGLLEILAITKQSLARVLKPLIEDGLVRSETGADDRRKRLLYLTEEGAAFEAQLSMAQRERLISAFREAGPEAVEGFRRVMALMIDSERRDDILDFVYSNADVAHVETKE